MKEKIKVPIVGDSSYVDIMRCFADYNVRIINIMPVYCSGFTKSLFLEIKCSKLVIEKVIEKCNGKKVEYSKDKNIEGKWII